MQETPLIAPLPPDDFRFKLLEEKINSLREIILEMLRANEKSLKLQAAEYERRLNALNHEAEQLKDMQEKYIPREVYDREITALRDEIKINNDWRIKQEGQGQGKGQYSEIIKWILPLILTVAFFLIMYYKNK